MPIQINKPRGTADFAFKDEAVYQAVEDLLDQKAAAYGCQKAETPVFEDEGLFVRGVGESTDIVTKEMFRLTVKGEHDYVLRPEFTAGINRMVIENKYYADPNLPLRISYCGPVFRFERPQAGRLREFHQWGVEFLDNKIDLTAAIDCVLLIYRSLESLLGRELLLKMNFLGSFASREKYKEALKAYYADKLDGMCEDCHHRFETNVLRILDCKVPEDIEINKGAPLLSDYLLPEDNKAFAKVLDTLDSLNVPYKIDERLVRGLDYYTGLVFEVYDPLNMELGAIGAGGQYANLMAELGGPSFEGIGFSIGMERVILALDELRKDELLKKKDSGLDYFIIDLRAEKDLTPAILADELRSEGNFVSSPSESKAISGALKMADRLQAKTSLIFDDYNPGMVLIKDMQTREQEAFKATDVDQIVAHLKEREKKE